MMDSCQQQQQQQQQFCLKWNSFGSNLATTFSNLFKSESLADVTLFCDGVTFKAHKLILAACSKHLGDLFETVASSSNVNQQNLLIILDGTSAANMHALLEFMYKGEVHVSQNALSSFLKAAECLQVKGLSIEHEKLVQQRHHQQQQQQQQQQHNQEIYENNLQHQQQANLLAPSVVEIGGTNNSPNNRKKFKILRGDDHHHNNDENSLKTSPSPFSPKNNSYNAQYVAQQQIYDATCQNNNNNNNNNINITSNNRQLSNNQRLSPEMALLRASVLRDGKSAHAHEQQKEDGTADKDLRQAHSPNGPVMSKKSKLEQMEQFDAEDLRTKMRKCILQEHDVVDEAPSSSNLTQLSPKREFVVNSPTTDGAAAVLVETSSTGGVVVNQQQQQQQQQMALPMVWNAQTTRQATVNTPNGRKLKCPFCERLYGYETNLRAHIRQRHQGIRVPCPFCARTFTRNNTVRRHIAREHQHVNNDNNNNN